MLWLSRIILDGVPFAYPTLYIRDVAWKYSLFRTRPQWWTIFSYDSHFDEFVPVTIVSYFSRCFNDVYYHFLHEEKTKKKPKRFSFPGFFFVRFFWGHRRIVIVSVQYSSIFSRKSYQKCIKLKKMCDIILIQNLD